MAIPNEPDAPDSPDSPDAPDVDLEFELETLRTDSFRHHASWKAASEGRTLRWVWTTADAWFLEPFFAERSNALSRKNGRAPLFKKPKVLADAPSNPTPGTMCYGYDQRGRVVIVRQYFKSGACSEIFHVWEDERVRWVAFDDRCWPDRCGEADLDHEGRVIATRSGGRAALFTWRDAKLVHVETRYATGGKTQIETEDDLAAAVTATPTHLRKPGPLLEQLEPLVVDAVVDAFEALELDEPAYCLIVSFAGVGNAQFPPFVGVGLDSERRSLLALADRGDLSGPLHEALWNVGDFEHYPQTVLSDEALVEEINRVILGNEAWKATYAAFERIAKALRERTWSPVTDDFVIAAIDFDGTNQSTALKKAAGAKLFTVWKKAGWVE